MFIVIKKIVSSYKKDGQGKVIKDPISFKPKVLGVKVVEETIRVSEIKSSRAYHKSSVYEENGIKDVTAVYMFGKKGDDSRTPEIHINENIDSWNKRIGAVGLKEEG